MIQSVNLQNIPERIGFLILLFLHKEISPEQHDELDRWVEESDDHMQLFELATNTFPED